MKTKILLVILIVFVLLDFVYAECVDSDGGIDYNIKGSISIDGQLRDTDECVTTNGLREFYCGGVAYNDEVYQCEYGCVNGACAKTSQFTPAPEPEPYPVKIIKCFDSDGGLNYYENGNITYEIVKWNAPQSHFPPEGRQEADYCGASQEGSCPASKTLNEAYCEEGEINLVPKEGEHPPEVPKYKKYDCSSEGKVCYKGVCVNEEDLKKNSEYIKEKAECEKQVKQHEEQRKQYLSFWRKLYFWFFNPSGKVTFSETNGIVKDSEGNPIKGAPVTMTALCSIEGYSTEQNTQQTISDNNGIFNFDSFTMKSKLPSSKCRKGFMVSKGGYCPYSLPISYFHCLREFKMQNISNVDSYSVPDMITVKAGVKDVSLILKKINTNTISKELEDLERELSTKQLEVAPTE